MPKFILHHTHDPDDCAASFAAWHGFDSSLRHRAASSTCLAGGHCLLWRVDVPGADDALALLPPFVAARTAVVEVRDVQIP